MRRTLAIVCAAVLLAAIAVFSWKQTSGQTKPVEVTPIMKADSIQQLPTTEQKTPMVPPPPTPCDDVKLYHADVIRNNTPDKSYPSVPTYHGSISLDSTTWTVKVPAEAYSLGKPYLIRFEFRSTYHYPSVYHRALKVLTKSQALTLNYLYGSPPQTDHCFVNVTAPNLQTIASMEGTTKHYLEVTDDQPAMVTLGEQYGVDLWYFTPDGVFQKKGSYAIKLDSCEAKPDNRFACK